MTEREIEMKSLKCLKSRDFCDKSKIDDRGSRLCRDNVSCADADCRECLRRME